MKRFKISFLDIVCAIAVIAIIMAIVGHYGSMGFNLKYFLCIDIPLYCFSIWALYMAIKIFKQYRQFQRYSKKDDGTR